MVRHGRQVAKDNARECSEGRAYDGGKWMSLDGPRSMSHTMSREVSCKAITSGLNRTAIISGHSGRYGGGLVATRRLYSVSWGGSLSSVTGAIRWAEIRKEEKVSEQGR